MLVVQLRDSISQTKVVTGSGPRAVFRRGEITGGTSRWPYV